jgi:CO/xanthine dehydrogenase Mo-binding subunit
LSVNANLAEYLVPVNAGIALAGVAPAIANAIYNATGRRVGHLPITPDRLLHVL